jgi:hypothetical protein
MASNLEKAMNERRETATAEARKKFPGARDIDVIFGHGRVIVEVKDKKGHWRRFEHVVDDDIVAAERVEETSRRREVIHG